MCFAPFAAGKVPVASTVRGRSGWDRSDDEAYTVNSADCRVMDPGDMGCSSAVGEAGEQREARGVGGPAEEMSDAVRNVVAVAVVVVVVVVVPSPGGDVPACDADSLLPRLAMR